MADRRVRETFIDGVELEAHPYLMWMVGAIS